jgi:hypothetical protein
MTCAFRPEFQCVSGDSVMHGSDKLAQTCHCHDYVYQCESAAHSENVRQKMERPGIMVQDLGNNTINDYLLTSFYNYIDERFVPGHFLVFFQARL